MMERVGVGAARLGHLLVGLAFAWGGAAQAQTIDAAAVGADAGVGARAMGMGGAFSALSDDATAISWNPAGATAADRPMLSAGYDPWARIEWDHPARTVSPWSYDAFKETAKSKLFSYASMAAPFRIGGVRLVALAGYRRALDLGLDRSLAYTYKSTASTTTTSSTYTYASTEAGGLDVFSAGVGVRLASALSLGVAVERWTGSARTSWQDREATETSVATSDGEATQEYRGFGVRLGALVEVSKKLRLAAVGRLPFKMDDKQTSSRHLARDPWEQQLDLTQNGRIDWPATLGFGVAARPADRLDVALDVIVGQWSKGAYANSYDSTATTTYQGDPQGPQSVHRTGDAQLLWPTLINADGAAANQRQADTFQVRLGTEYRLRVSRAISLPLRAGGVFDRQLTRETDAKPVRGIGATAGLGVAAPHFSLDVAWVLGTGKLGVDGASEKVKRNAQRLCVSASIKP